MKNKIISLFICLTVVLQLCLSVAATENTVVYELDAESYGTGKFDETIAGATAEAEASIETDADGSLYVAMRDNDLSNELVFGPKIDFSGKRTVTFDYRLISDVRIPGMLYLDYAISLTLAKSPYYYDNGTINLQGNIPENEWINITLITDSESKTFDLYTDGVCIGENIPTRGGAAIGGVMQLKLMCNRDLKSGFDFKNLKVYDGEIIPEISEKMMDTIANPERILVDYTGAYDRLNDALGNAVAMTVGNSVARVNNKYINIDPAEPYVAPFITSDGYTLIPTRFTTETIGCSVEVLSSTSFRFSKGGTVMEINMGDKNAIINGTPVEMPTVPVIKYDRLFIPLRFAAETYGKNVFWDDRGLIVISDGEVVKAGQEDIIKPLIADIRNHTSVFGNKKYSDVNYSSRALRIEGHDGGQWGSLDAAKRFMANVNRWTYAHSGEDAKKLIDLGLLNQGTLNANASGDYSVQGHEKNATSYWLGGKPYVRSDGVNGATWGCMLNPNFTEYTRSKIDGGLDSGIFMWQYDDWALNTGYTNGGCLCEWCNSEFGKYLKNEASQEELASIAEQGITDVSDFDYIQWLKGQGITNEMEYSKIQGTPIDSVRNKFYLKRLREFHTGIIEYIKQKSGSVPFYSVNMSNALSSLTNGVNTWVLDTVDGVMGETGSGLTSAGNIVASMIMSSHLGLENVVSPLPKDNIAKELMYAAIPMTYATGQFMLVPWDDWLHGSTRYYATLEELGQTFEFPREYPYLFDNYEIPEVLGYLFDLDENTALGAKGIELINKGIPFRGIVRKEGNDVKYTFDADDLKGLQAVVAVGQLPNLTAEEKAVLENSGTAVVRADDKASIDWLESTYWTVRDNNEEVYTILRKNQLYDDAPVVVHAVNSNIKEAQKNIEIELNNLWLPEGNTLKVNVYRPGENVETMSVPRGSESTKLTLSYADRWAVLEICGDYTIRRDAAFKVDDFGGMGIGSRISYDKASGTADNFTFVTYSEGINSSTYGDSTGTQDEIAFVYKRLGKSSIKSHFVKAGFGEADGAFGVMIREGIYSNAKFAALVYDEENGLRLARRRVTDKAVIYENLGNTRPAYMKLGRDGNEYVAYVSDDDVNYTEAGRVEIQLDNPVGGVFAASPDGSKAQCNVRKLIVSSGSFNAGEFESFRIGYRNGTINQTDKGAALEYTLESTQQELLSIDDVNVEFKSSNENVLRITDKGTLIPVKEGTATITATAKMGLKRISASTNITVNPLNRVMFEESFDSDVFPSYMERITAGVSSVKDGALTLTAENTGEENDITFEFDQIGMPAVFEFDFKAKFGKDSNSTGARVIYANDLSGMALTADPAGFNWFFGNAQTHIMPIEEDRWYHIKLEANYSDQWANVYIDGEKIISNGQTRGGIASNGKVRIGAWRLGKDSCYQWDNFKIYFVDGLE